MAFSLSLGDRSCMTIYSFLEEMGSFPTFRAQDGCVVFDKNAYDGITVTRASQSSAEYFCGVRIQMLGALGASLFVLTKSLCSLSAGTQHYVRYQGLSRARVDSFSRRQQTLPVVDALLQHAALYRPGRGQLHETLCP